MRFETIAIDAADRPDADTGAISVSIYGTPAFVFEDVDDTSGWNYSRMANPTKKVLEDTIAQPEGRKAGFAFVTGMAAETTVTHLLKTGDHATWGDGICGGTDRLFQDVMSDFGLEVTLLRMDNTFSTRYFSRPIEYAIDLVIRSTTKYLSGHRGAVSDTVVATTDELTQTLQFRPDAMGTCAAPYDCWLVLHGIETLPVRMKQHQENAFVVANYLKGHPKLKRMHIPGSSHIRDTAIARKPMKGFGGVLSLELTGGIESVNASPRRLKVFSLAESLGVHYFLCRASSYHESCINARRLQGKGCDYGCINPVVG